MFLVNGVLDCFCCTFPASVISTKISRNIFYFDRMTVDTNGPAISNGSDLVPEIPKTCKAGIVVNEGPDFTMRVEEVPVPEPGEYTNTTGPKTT